MKKIKYEDYRMAFMELNLKARQMSDGSISVYEDMPAFETKIKLGINWAGCGTKSAEDTEKFAATLIKIVGMVETFQYNGYEIEYAEEAPKTEVRTKQYETKEEVRKEVEKAVKANGITEKEEKVLRAIIAGSNFDCCELDITKSWEEQELECGYFEAFADVKDYGCGMTKGQVRGIFGSLSKKNLIELSKDEDGDGKPFTWIVIREKSFNNIKKVLSK